MRRSLAVAALICAWSSEGVSWGETTQEKLLTQTNRSAAELKANLVVVYNRQAPESERLAKYYALVRGIPKERLVGVSTSRKEEIDRDTFEQTIWNPLNAHFEKQGWMRRRVATENVNGRQMTVQKAVASKVWALVLMYGMPLKIKHDPAKNDVLSAVQAANNNGASVDSELATLPTLGLPISGLLPNPYFFSGYPRPFDGVDARKLILVTRLDGPNADVVKRMIDDSLYAEKNRLVGRAVFDIRGLKKGNNYFAGDEWIRGAYSLFRRAGWDVILDKSPHLIPATEPLAEVGFYAGWYSHHARAPFFRSPQRFTRGALAYHLHSFSARSLRQDGRGQLWTGPLLKAGAAASMGTVYEPYLDYTPHVDIFADRLLQHFTLAEAAYMSQKALSWMTVVVGDPLYRPFAVPLAPALAASEQRPSEHTTWLQLEAVRRALRQATTDITERDLRVRLLTANSSGRVWEAYGDMLGELNFKKNHQEVVKAYDMASTLSGRPVDAIRVGKKKANLYRRLNQKGQAAVVLKQLRERWPKEAEQFGLNPKPPPPKKPKEPSPQHKPSAPPRAIPVQPR